MIHIPLLARNHLKNILIVGILMALYGAAWIVFDIPRLLTVETLTAHRIYLLSIVDQNYYAAVSIYLCALILHSILALPATSFFFIAGGMLFGGYHGALYALIGSLIGGYILFCLTSLHLGAALHRRYQAILDPLKERIRDHAFTSLIIMRSIPIVPFFLINITAGLAMVSHRIFIISLAIGSLPSIFLYVFLGTEMTRLSCIITLLQHPFLVMGVVLTGCCLIYGIRLVYYRLQQPHAL